MDPWGLPEPYENQCKFCGKWAVFNLYDGFYYCSFCNSRGEEVDFAMDADGLRIYGFPDYVLDQFSSDDDVGEDDAVEYGGVGPTEPKIEDNGEDYYVGDGVGLFSSDDDVEDDDDVEYDVVGPTAQISDFGSSKKNMISSFIDDDTVQPSMRASAERDEGDGDDDDHVPKEDAVGDGVVGPTDPKSDFGLSNKNISYDTVQPAIRTSAKRVELDVEGGDDHAPREGTIMEPCAKRTKKHKAQK